MNRALLLLLSVLTFRLFGSVFPADFFSTPHPDHTPLETPAPQKTPFPKAAAILMDTVPPVLDCPASSIVILQTEGACDTVLNFTVTATDDQGPAIVIQLSGLSTGSVFPLGVSTCVFLATDLAGNTATCAFSFTVVDGGVVDLVCDDLYEVELNANCAKALLAQEVLEGGPYGCWNRYFTEVDKTMPFGNGPWVPALFGPADIGKTYQNRVTDMITGNKCWGNVKILDKIPPVFNCQDITVSCAEDNISPDFLKDSLGIAAAKPQVNDACGGISFLGHFDTNISLDCDSPFTAIVQRVWQANDQNGNSSTCLQRIKRHRHTISEIQIPPNITLQCPDTNVDPSQTGQPYLIYQGKRYEMENNSICDISAFYSDNTLNLPCGDKRVRRLWELFDFCSGNTSNPFIQNIYLLDESSPTIACPSNYFVVVNADTCHGLIDLPNVVLSDACSEVASFQAFWEDNGLSKTLLGSLADFPGNDLANYDTLGVLGQATMPVGTTTVSYVVEDSCGNIGDCTFNITIADMVPPVVRCDSLLTVQLLEDGLLAIAADWLDAGSTDACTPLSFKARLNEETSCTYGTAWSDSLRFCCLNQNDTLNATLRAYDIPIPKGNVTDSLGIGHFSDCTLKIIITDPNPPLCVAPPNLTLNCEDFDPTLEAYGTILSTSCAVDSTAMKVDYTQFDSLCKKGFITRIFEVFDAAGNIGGCAQALTVDYVQDYFTKFPDDVIVTACDGTGNYGAPIFFGQNCEQFDVGYEDEIFTVVPDACYKIERTWRITNQCAYDSTKPLIIIPNPNPNATANHPNNLPGPVVSACNTTGLWAPTIVKINPTDPIPTLFCTFWADTANGYEYKQIIKVIDAQAPTGTYTVPVCTNQDWATPNNPQLWNETYWTDPIIGGNNLSEEPTALSITATDACAGSNIKIEFLLFLDLDGDNITETVINSEKLGTAGLGWNNVPFNNINNPNFAGGTPRSFDERPVMPIQKMGFALEETVSGNNRIGHVRWNTEDQPNTYFNPELPHGTHTIKWFITDDCGNNKEYDYSFTVKDCKKPTVVCSSGLSANIEANGSVAIDVSNLLGFTEDNCTPPDQILTGIRKCGTGTGFPFTPNLTPVKSLSFYCPDLGAQCIEVWAADKAGNTEYCETSVLIQDNLGNCSGNGAGIYGWVKTELGTGVEEVSINIDGSCLFCPPLNIILGSTDSLGYYSFPNLVPQQPTYDISPALDNNVLNGVTTYDLVLISKHILGVEALNSPYKMISADANKSGSITTFDIVEFRKLILGTYTQLPNNTSWRFVDSSFVFPNPLNPFQPGFPDTIQLDSPKPYNFIGMKVGDVNNTAISNLHSEAEERFDGTTYFQTEDRVVHAGEIFELPFSATERLEGCQFSLETDGLEILEILPGAQMSKENFGLFYPNNLLTMAWETGGLAHFSLKMKAQKTGSLQDMLRITDRITRAEAYSSVGQPLLKKHLTLRFGNTPTHFELYQNQPNPFGRKTAISFYLPEASPALLKIVDENGKVLWTQSGDWPAGMNTLDVDLGALSEAGILYYQLETPTNRAVRKMVRI